MTDATEDEKILSFCRRLVKDEAWETLVAYLDGFVVDHERPVEILFAPLRGTADMESFFMGVDPARDKACAARERLRAAVFKEIKRRPRV